MPPLGHGVARRLLGHRRVERRVEDRDVRHVGQRGLRLLDRTQGRRIVKWRQRSQLADRSHHLRVDHDRIAESRSPVHDAVSNGVTLAEAVHRM